ncbi:iron ABC transporter ATP-binding protein [Moorella thermoacetica]|uniref:ABC transporter related protein n=1 Tax=Moorella thermoacetica (strain ATCC 39073 / JCM 9320) TaxID=264732 RepID=Q2RIG5_MOOTA|nr:ABC transporter ATP-binding protein [Moorella thermoacetica]AKX94246.1 putative siderophore transport system ATP-binding protein YusV [Moorella thermoacetica]AKX96885.1 putative siderophore transport system ATP-binding protein YusV [Moorella thermoacetica]OIQ58055.1 putative siderophore transport system ATP-binding protein YusV [Moorella thermoacetica]QDA00714.1 putative siderophore transport system ATP-binding protein YusV [Moorella thermoacetica]TYL11609.1 Ferric enterobactin transport AT
MILAVDGVEFSYNSHAVLRDIKFAVARGEFLAILGNNGAGKSTLLKCLNKILKPRRGTIMIEKDNIFNLSRLEVARKMGYVAQRYESGRVTVFDAVLLGRKPHIKWDVSPRDLEVVQRVLRVLDLEGFALRYLDELSGGELQKVIIARALAQEPGVLLLDEPTSNLDLKNQLEVLKTIKGAVKEQKLAAVVVMHDLNLALRFADKFLLLKNSTVFACGGMEIMTPENLTSVYGVPVTLARMGPIPVIVPLIPGGP